MPFTRINYTYTDQTVFAVDFTLGYLSRSHVTCRVNDEVDGSGNPLYRPLTWVTSGTVSVGGASLVSGDSLVFERTIPKGSVQHDYQDGALLIERNLDESFLQALMLAQEALDGRFGVIGQDVNMGAYKLTNLAPGVAATDSATMTQLLATTSLANSTLSAAQASATAASTSASEAATSASSVLGAVSTTATNASNSTASAILAQKWATENEDVAVVTGQFSARHWALKAQASAAGSATTVSYSNATSGLTAINVQAAIDELDTLVSTVSFSVVDDLTPQLGGDLDVNGNAIEFAGGSVDNLATKAQAEAGTATDKLMTPLRTKQAVAVRHDQEADTSAGSGTVTLNANNGVMRKVTATGNITIDFTPTAGRPCSYVLQAVNFGAHTITWTGVDEWAGGTAPALTSSGEDFIGIIGDDGGLTYGYLIIKGAA